MFCNDSVSTKTNRNCRPRDAVHGFVLKLGRPLQGLSSASLLKLPQASTHQIFETTQMMLHSMRMMLLNRYQLNDIDAHSIQETGVCHRPRSQVMLPQLFQQNQHDELQIANTEQWVVIADSLSCPFHAFSKQARVLTREARKLEAGHA